MKPGPEGLPSPLNTDSQNLSKLGSPCQDMKPGPWGLQVIIIYHYIGINTKQSLTGGSEDLAVTLRPEKNNVQLSGRLCFLTGPFFFRS